MLKGKLDFSKIGLGVRTWKTVLAVGIVLLIAWACNYDAPFYAGIAALLCIQPNPVRSVSFGAQRMVGTVVAGIVAVFMLWVISFTQNKLLTYACILVSLVISFSICNIIKFKNSCGICGLVTLAIMLNHSQQSDSYIYAITRVIETLIGIVIAVGVNFIPPWKNWTFKQWRADIKNGKLKPDNKPLHSMDSTIDNIPKTEVVAGSLDKSEPELSNENQILHESSINNKNKIDKG